MTVGLQSLPAELRRQIWYDTFPDARLIQFADVPWPRSAAKAEEPASRLPSDDEAAETTCNYMTYLRPTIKFSEWTALGYSGTARHWLSVRKGTCPRRGEGCADPVALRVCWDSRAIALELYCPFRHARLPTHTFYFNPRTDVLELPLWSRDNIAEDEDRLAQIAQYCGTDLDRIERVVSRWRLLDDPATLERHSVHFRMLTYMYKTERTVDYEGRDPIGLRAIGTLLSRMKFFGVKYWELLGHAGEMKENTIRKPPSGKHTLYYFERLK